MHVPDCGVFEQWLRDCRRRIVGRAGYAYDCPLANWLSSVWVCTCWVAEGTYGMGLDAPVAGELPAWAVAFEAAFDRTYAGGERVTGRQALVVLKQIGEVA